MQINRLQYPYEPNCTSHNVLTDQLSTFYSQTVCHSSCMLEDYIKQCGDVPNYWMNMTSRKIKTIYKTTLRSRLKCLKKTLFDFRSDNCKCTLSCTETRYKARVKTLGQNRKGEWYITIRNDDTRITKIVQVPDYSLEDCLGNVGGILGLAIGASCLSLVEIILYCVMYIFRKLY